MRRIAGGDLEPGQALPSEEELAAEFDVSRPVIREAVKELAVIGLVESRQGRSTRVTAKNRWNHFDPRLLFARSEIGAIDDVLLELLELRRVIEAGAAGLAAVRRTPATLDELDHEIAMMERSIDDPEAFTDSDIRFHDAILRATGNSLLLHLFDLIGPLIRVGRRVSLERRPDGPAESLHGHVAIRDAIRAGDADEARRRMRDHLSWTANLKLRDEEGRPA